MRRRETVPQYISSVMFSFIAFVALLASVSCAFLAATLLSQEYYLREVNRSTFAATAVYELRQTYRSYAAASGIPPAVLEDSISEEQIRAALAQSVRAAFSDEEEEYDYSAYTLKLEEALDRYAAAQGAQDSPEQRQALAQLAAYCTNSFAALSNSLLFNFLPSVVGISGTVTLLAFVLGGVSFVCIALIVLLSRRLSVFLRSAIYSLSALLICSAAIPLLFRASGFLQRMNLQPPSMKQYIAACVAGFFTCYWWLCAVTAVLLGVCIVALALRRKRRRRPKSGMPPRVWPIPVAGR